jgi:hypothetical protein
MVVTDHHGIHSAVSAREELVRFLKESPGAGALFFLNAGREIVRTTTAEEQAKLDETVAGFGANWQAKTTQLASKADVFWVSSDMMKLIGTATNDLSLDVAERKVELPKLTPRLLLSDIGFTYFADELGIEASSRNDGYAEVVPLRGVGWIPSPAVGRDLQNGLFIILFADVTNDPNTADLRDALRSSGAMIPSLMPVGVQHWAWNEDADGRTEGFAPVDDRRELDPSFGRWLTAFWHLCHEEVAVKVQASVPRAQRRRMEREGQKIPEVTVITLRRPKHAVDEGHVAERRQYTHSFLVRGHWRNQAMGRNWSERRLRYVHPYIKGEGPFVPKTRVFRVAR